MAQDTILKFTGEELQVMQDRIFFRLKHSSTAKLVSLFGGLEVILKEIAQTFSPDVPGLNTSSGKIFRGENYKGYPYVLLDCPRLFSKQSVFAFRTMFWWGNEFSFTMHLQGEALDMFRKRIQSGFDLLRNQEIYFCVSDTPWQYTFTEDNYLLIDDIFEKARAEVASKPFIKFSRKIPVGNYDQLMQHGAETLNIFLSVL